MLWFQFWQYYRSTDNCLDCGLERLVLRSPTFRDFEWYAYLRRAVLDTVIERSDAPA